MDDNPSMSKKMAVERGNTLKRLRLTYTAKNQFAPGNLVVWKEGMCNRKKPAYGEPAVVMEVLDPPIIDPEHEAGVSQFMESLSLKLAIVGRDGDFDVYHFDGNRFEHYVGK